MKTNQQRIQSTNRSFFPARNLAHGLAALILGFSLSAQAQTTNLVWDPAGNGTDGGGTWNTSGLVWTNPVTGGADIAWRNSSNDIALFGRGNGAAGVVGVATIVTNGGITFNATGLGTYIITNGTIFLGGTATISNNVSATIGSVIAGTSGLIKAGTGTLILTNANTFTGGVTINASGGTLEISNNVNALQGNATVNSGGTLWLTAGNATYTNSISGAGLVQITAGSGDVILNNLIGSWSAFTGTLDLLNPTAAAGKTRFNTTQTGLPAPSAIAKVENGTTLYLNQALQYGLTVQLLGSAGNSENLGSLRLEAGANATNSVVLMTNTTIGVNATAATISGVISESGGSFGFVKVGNNTLTNSGANTYSGKTYIQGGGTLAVKSINSVVGGSASSGLGHPTTVANGTIDIGNSTTSGNTLNYLGTGETSDRVINLAGTTGGSTIVNNGTGLLKFTSDFTATNSGAKSLGLGGTTGNGEIAGNIPNSSGGITSVTKNSGTNTWTLSAVTNTFTGSITVSAGTLVWNSKAAINPGGGAVTVSSGGALQVNGPITVTGNGGTSGYFTFGNNAAGGLGTVQINSGGSLSFASLANNPNSIVGQQGTGGYSQLTANGGSFSYDGTAGIILGNGGGSGILTVTNGGTVTLQAGSFASTDQRTFLSMGRGNLTSTGMVYLASGTLASSRVFILGGAAPFGQAYFYFDGGTLKALANQTDWLQSTANGATINPLTAVTINAGGAKIDANNFSVAINNALASGAVADGGLTLIDSSVAKNGSLTLGGTCAYNGPTTVSNGTLTVSGSIGSGAVTVAGGKLAVSGTVSGATTVNPGGTIIPSTGAFSSLVTLTAGNSAVNLQDGATSTTTFANGLTLNNGNVLSFDLGASSDSISVGGTFTHNGTTTINLAAITGISATTYTLITGASIATTNGFALGNVPSGYLGTLVSDGANLQVTLTQNAPSTAYWKGNLDNKWNTVSGGTANWTTDSGGTANAGVPPGTPTAVMFAATGAGNFSTLLGANFTINNLTLSTANNVTIGGATNTLSIVNGLLNDTTALNNTLSVSNIVLVGSQTWQNNSANPLTISSLVNGSSALTTAGSGTIVLTSTNNNYSGGTTVSAGTLQLGDGAASNGAVSGAVEDDSALVFANPLAQTFSGTISGGGGALGKTGSGLLTLTGVNSYGAGTTISNGTVQLNNTSAAGSGAITVAGNLNLQIATTGDATLANAINGAGVVNVMSPTANQTTFGGDMSGFTGMIEIPGTPTTAAKTSIRSAAVNLNSAATIIITNGGTLFMELCTVPATIYVSGPGNSEGYGAFRVDNGAVVSGNVILQGNTTIGGNFTSGTISGVIDDANQGYGISSGNAGTQTEILSGLNTYHGATTWNRAAYTLTLANGSALQNSTLNYTAGTLVFDSSVSSNAFVFGGLTGTANISLANNASSPITLSVGNNGGNTTYSGILSDGGLTGSLTKVGTGTLTLSGANSYTGTTTVAGGKLAISTLQTTATAGIVVNDSATLAVNAFGTNQLAPASYTLATSTVATNEFSGLSSTIFAPVNAGSLSLNGTIRVNITSGIFAAGNTYPLIAFTSIGGTGGFVLGSLPRGMTAGIITNGGNTIALNVTAYSAVTDVWTGSVNTNWDISSTTNWLVSGNPNTYLDGDNARFDDTATQTNVFVTTIVAPLNTVVSNATKNYTFTGSGIGGVGGLTKQGAGTLVLGQANTYSGNTVVSNGTLKLAAANVIPGGTGKGDVVVAAVLDLNSNSVTINGLSGSGTVDTVAGGTPTLTVGSSGSSMTFGGTLQNTAGTLALTKTGNGTLTLSGTNTYTGATTVNQGTLNYNGSLGIAPAAAATVLNINNVGSNAVVSIGSSANLRFNNASGNNFYVGNNAAGAGAVYQTGGTISGIFQFQLGAVTGGSYGYYNLSGGSNTMSELDLGGFNGAAVGVCDISSGVVNITTWFVPSRGTAALGMLNMTGGTLNYSGPAGQFQGNWNAGVGTAVLNLANASLLAPLANVNLMQTGVAGKLGEINLLTGGLLQANSIAPGSASGNSVLNFNGGTLKANAATATFLSANNTAVNVYASGGTIDNNGVNITIPVALQAPAGDGLNGLVTVDSGGSGYIGAPAVTFTGDGVGAAGYAVMSGGSVASIVMTSPGYGYSGASVVFTGGGGSGASATAPTPTANNSGGVKFIGSGITTLSGANSYTGNTTISNGTVLVNGSTSSGATSVGNGGTLGGIGTVGGAVTLNNGGTLAPGSGGIGELTVSGNITLNAGSTNTFEVNGTTPANDMVAAGGTVTYGGVLNIVPSGSFTAGQTFPLFSGAGAVNASNFAIPVVGSPGSGLGFTFTNGLLTVVTTGPSGPATIANSFSGGVLSLSWPASQGWRLQMQTNSLSTGLGTNWNYITDGSISSTNITVDPTKPTVFYRLRYP